MLTFNHIWLEFRSYSISIRADVKCGEVAEIKFPKEIDRAIKPCYSPPDNVVVNVVSGGGGQVLQ
jgi:hypothetical protein